MLSSLMDLLDRSLSVGARQRPGFRQAPDRLQGGMPTPAAWEPVGLDVPPLVWRREDMTGAQRGAAGVLVEPGLRISSLPFANPDQDADARLIRLSGSGLRTLCETHWNPSLRPALRRSLDPRMKLARLDGETILLGAYYADCRNYFHFWIDAMCDLWFLRQCGLDLSSVAHVLMPWNGAGWQVEIARLCGLPLERIVPLSSADGFVLEKAHVAVRTKGGTRNHDWLVQAVREVSGWQPPARGPSGRRIYVMRRGTVRRPLLNEAEILGILAPYDFEIIDCAQMSVADQRRCFAEAEAIVAPHGAGLTNIVWARPGARLIEFMPRAHANPCFMDLAAQAGLIYRNIPSTAEVSGVDAIYAGFAVDPAHLAATLREVLDG